MPIRGVLFDFGFTLFAHATLADTIRQCAASLGVPIDDAQAAALSARIDAAAMAPAEISHPRDLDPAVWTERWKVLYRIADEVAEGLGAAVNESMHDPLAWIPYRDTATTLQALLGRDVAVGVISNTGWDVRAVFDAHGVTPLISSFTLSCEVGVVKPQPRIFEMACASLRVAPEDALMVGDDPRSDGGAVATKMRTLLLPPGPPGSDNGLGAVLRLLGDD